MYATETIPAGVGGVAAGGGCPGADGTLDPSQPNAMNELATIHIVSRFT